MATNIEALVNQAMEVRHRLEERGAAADAKVVERLVQELTSARPKAERPYYTIAEAAELIGVSGQTVKNWISRGLLKGYRLGGRIVILRSELAEYRAMAEASKGIEPLPSREEIVDAVREGRRRFLWPMEPQEKEP